MRKFFHLPRRGSRGLDLLLLFSVEGALLQFTGSINSFGNNLYATNLGATDAQIGLIQLVPNAAAMLLMLPLGILSDRAKSSRTVPLVMLLCMIVGYVAMGLVPAAGSARMTMFFAALAFTVGGPVLYGAQWQNFFGDVVAMEGRNRVLTVRNRFMFIIGIAAPILCGVLMGLCSDTQGKLMVLQIFFLVCAAVTFAQAVVISRIRTPVRNAETSRGVSLKQVGQTIVRLARNRSFRLFYIPVVIFYMIWQMDWSMWYIGQVQYLGLNEAELSITSGVFNVGQLVAVGILSRSVRRRSADYALIFAAAGLLTCPFIMMGSSLLPPAMRFPAFTVLMTVLNAPQCAVNLCVVQILLRVAPAECRSLAVSLFTLSTTLTNSFMPLLGVQLYTAMGTGYGAFIAFNSLTAVLRVAALLMLIWRYHLVRRRGEVIEDEAAAA